MSDGLAMWLLGGGSAFLMIALMSVGLRSFVALKTPPTVRAAWTAGIAYFLTVLILMFGGFGDLELQAPLFSLPGALIVFLYWRYDFRQAWVDDPRLLPPDAHLANDDWAAGLLKLAGLVLTAFAAALIRMALRGH